MRQSRAGLIVRVRNLEKRYKVLWLRYWTRFVRRDRLYQQRNAILRKWQKKYSGLSKGNLLRLGRILSALEKDKHLMILSRRQYTKLWRLLQ